jgi:antitoxin ParD1/3/4
MSKLDIAAKVHSLDIMPTKGMNVSLPSTLRRWIERRVTSGGYGSVSEYVRQLVRHDQGERVLQDLDQQLIAAIESGPAAPLTQDDWSEVRKIVRESRQKGRSDR